jgi:hypothetical protein
MNDFRLRTTIATALLLIAGVWTVGARAQSEKKEGGWVRISAFTNIPVADADIVISEWCGHCKSDGKLVFEQDHATNDRGFYAAEVHPIPKNFRVTVTWEPTQAPYRSLGMVRMSADVRDHDPMHGLVYVNPVTTIVSRVLDRRPDLSLAEAQAIVRSFLGMPANTSLGAAMREGPYFQSPVFSESEFLKQAIAYGSADGFLENLVTQAIYNPNDRHLFRPTAGLGSTPPANPIAGIAGDIALELGKGALSWLGGKGVGWAASAAGLFQPDATAADIAQLQTQLEGLQSSVDALSNQLAQSTAQIEAAVNFADYNTIASQELKLAAQVNVVEQDVAVLADGCPPATTQPAPPLSKFCKSQKALVAKELSESEIHAAFEEFASALEDQSSAGTKGMLHLFSLFTGQTVGHFFRYGDSIKIWNMWGYWYSVETQAANLKVELLHLQDAQDNVAGQKELTDFLGDNNITDNLSNVLNAEAALVFPVLPQGEVVNTEDKFIWMTTYPGTTVAPGCKAGLSSPPNGTGGVSFGPHLAGSAASVIPYPGDPATTWYSPETSQLTSLIHGWTFTPGFWLSSQTGTKPDDPPGVTSIPFAPGLDTLTNPGCIPNGPWVWTKTPVTAGDNTNYVVINFNTGSPQPSNSSVGKQGNSNWELLVGQFQIQYYWYN